MPTHDLIETLTKHIMTEITTASLDRAPAPDTLLIETGIIDSLGLFKLVSFIEDEFKVKVEPEDILIENFATLNAIAGLIRSKIPK